MQLSDFELDVMQVVWERGECSAPQVHEAIRRKRDVAYSTVKTVIDRLERKGALQRARSERGTIFVSAAISSDSVQRTMLDSLISHVFAGDRKPLFNQLIGDDELSASDLEYLERLIAQRREGTDDD